MTPFELSSENSYNLFVPQLPLLTREMLLEMQDILHDGLLEMPVLICCGKELVQIEREAMDELKELARMLVEEGGALMFAEFTDELSTQLQWHRFMVWDHLHDAIDEAETLQTDREFGMDMDF